MCERIVLCVCLSSGNLIVKMLISFITRTTGHAHIPGERLFDGYSIRVTTVGAEVYEAVSYDGNQSIALT